MALEKVARQGLVGKVQALREECPVLHEPSEAGLLEGLIVIGREAVGPDDGDALAQEALRHMEADEPGRAGHQNGRGHTIILQHERSVARSRSGGGDPS